MSIPAHPRILLIMGSVRAGRRCPQIAAFVMDLLVATNSADCEIIDLRDWNLPSDDEPSIPAKGVYTQDHTHAWSAKVAAAAAFIIVSPQYNWGYPAALKNALDHLFNEWAGKKLMIVTYGGHGGGKCAEQLVQVAGALGLQPVGTMPAIIVARDHIVDDTPQPDADLAPFATIVRKACGELLASG